MIDIKTTEELMETPYKFTEGKVWVSMESLPKEIRNIIELQISTEEVLDKMRSEVGK